YIGIIINTKIKTDKSLMDKATKLEFVGRLGSGLDIIDLPYAKEKGIQIVNSPEGNCNAVAEHAIGMLLALQNNMTHGDREVRAFNWNREKNRGNEITGKTIGIIGFGHTGSALAKRLRGFDMRILAYDKYKVDYASPLDYAMESNLKQIQAESDYISFHLPLTEETHHMANASFFEDCQNCPVIINTSRGKVVDTRALLSAIKENKIAGACLDVFENEKVSTFTPEEKELYNSLYQLENVILTPHVAGWTHESKRKIAETLLEKLL
ncbi:MAG: NAD(P)-dependent oxidoreductase, partial [Bacteroidota bacterium]